MKNLKRALSFALASVMVIGMMVVGAGAAFTDAEKITNDEAVDVMVALGVIAGKDNGSFDPEGTLTRAEAAKIITFMLLGPDKAKKLGTTTVSFTDVPAGHWAASYIGYCANMGILSGKGDGTFGPSDPLTGHAFGKMLLVALGYDAKIEKYTGTNDWAINVAVAMVEAGIDLDDDVVLDNPISRENACLMAFKALSANMVNYDNKGTEITLADGTKVVMGASDAETITSTTTGTYDTLDDEGDTNVLQFAEKHFKKLTKKAADTDAFGRPAVTWYYGDVQNSTTKVGTYGETAKYTVVVSGTKNDTLAEILDAEELELAPNTTSTNFKGTYAINGAVTTVTVDSTAMTAVHSAIDAVLGNGVVVELFTNSKGEVDAIVTYEYDVVKISKIAKAADDADYDSLVTFKALDDTTFGSYKNTKIAGFNDSYAKNDVVVVVKKDATDLLFIAAADSVDGKMTANGAGYIKIDGEKKTTAEGYTAGTDYTNEYTFYLDPNGFVMDKKAITETNALEYLFLKDVEVYGSQASLKEDAAAKALAKVTFLDGTTEIVNLWVKKATKDLDAADISSGTVAKDDWYIKDPANGKAFKISATDGSEDSTATAKFAAGFYAYTMKDGMYVLSATLSDSDVTGTAYVADADTVVLAKENASVTGSASGTATSKTVLTVIDDAVKTYTGIKNFPSTTFEVDTNSSVTATNVAVKGILKLVEDGYITKLYVIGGSAIDEASWAYFTGAGDTTADGTTYNGYVDGKDVAYINDSALKGLYDVEIEDGEVKTAATTNVAYGTVKTVDETFIVLEGGSPIYFADKYAIYNISGDFTGEVTDLTKGDVVAIGTDGTKIEVVYVIDAPEVKGVKTGDSEGAATAVDYVQSGAELTVSGTAGTKLYVTFDGTNWTEVDDIADAVNGKLSYTTVAGTAGAAFSGIVLTIDVASMI